MLSLALFSSTAPISGDLRRLSSRVSLYPPLWIRPPPRHFRGSPSHRTIVAGQQSSAAASGDDFISRVLKENPSQVEPKFLVGDRLLTLREKQQRSSRSKLLQLVKRIYRDAKGEGLEGSREVLNRPVYLKDLLREYKGKLYVPEEVFRESLSEEEEFEKNLEELPVMSFEDFQKHLKADKVKLLTSRSVADEFKDFVVDLKEIPGDKNLQKTKWSAKSNFCLILCVFWMKW